MFFVLYKIIFIFYEKEKTRMLREKLCKGLKKLSVFCNVLGKLFWLEKKLALAHLSC
jgi:hypothetical protein